MLGPQSRWPGLHQQGVEASRAGKEEWAQDRLPRHDMDVPARPLRLCVVAEIAVAGGVEFDGGPLDQIVGGRGETRSFTPVHPESSVHAGSQQTTVDDLGDDGAALGGAHGVRRTGKCRTVLGPRPQVARGGDEEPADLAVEGRVQADEAAVGGFHHPRVFAPARPLPRLPGIVSGVEHRYWFDVEVDAVGARGQSDAGRPAVATDGVLGSERRWIFPSRTTPPGLNTSFAAQRISCLLTGQVNRASGRVATTAPSWAAKGPSRQSSLKAAPLAAGRGRSVARCDRGP